MRVVFVLEHFYPENGGVPVVARYLAEGLVNNHNHEVFAVTRKKQNEGTEDEYRGIPIYRYNVWYSHGYKIGGEADAFYNKVLELNPDVLILECAQCVTTDILLPNLHSLKCKKILHSHDFSGLWLPWVKLYPSLKSTLASPKNYMMWRRYYYSFFKRYVNEFDLILYISALGKDKEFFDRYAKARVEILPNAADDMFFNKEFKNKTKVKLDEKNRITRIRKYCDIKANKYFLCLSNYDKRKNQRAVLIEYYKSSQKNIALIFIGSIENKYLEELRTLEKRLSRKYGKREVYFLVDVERVDIPQIIYEAELSLTASRWEAYSIALIETMAVGTPFICTNVGNARLLPGGKTINKTSEMHTELDRLMDDELLLNTLSANGIQYANDHCRKENAVNRLNEMIFELYKENDEVEN